MLLALTALLACGSDDHRAALPPSPTLAPTATATAPGATPTPSAAPTRSASPTASATLTGTAADSPTPTPTATPDRSGLATPVAGTSLYFDLDADLSDPDRFYDLPYPSDLRLDAMGRPQLSGYPGPAANPILAPLRAIADDRPGFPTVPVAYFRFTGPLAARAVADVIPAHPAAPILLLDVTTGSPQRGALLPVIATTLQPDPYVAEFVLAVAARPGIVLAPQRTYAVVVMRAAGDASGQPLGVPAAFAVLRAGGTPDGVRGDAARRLYAGLWDTLDARGIARADVAAATVFTTGDVVAEMARVGEAVAARDTVEIADLHLDPRDGTQHERFCELAGTVRMPQFQQGTPPFDSEGLFAFDAGGVPIAQRVEAVPIVLTIPRRPMPAVGYPLVVYFHGSGGLHDQVVDRGPVTEPGGTPQPGKGPAHVLAAHGFATLGSALPLNPERLPGATNLVYINFRNLAAYRDTFRQGALEQRLLLDAVARLRIDPALLSGCDGPSLAPASAHYSIRPVPILAMGQSMGAQYANMVGATHPGVGAVTLTGSGGLWSLLVLTVELVPGTPTEPLVAAALGTTAPLSHLHPGLHLLQTVWEPADPIAYAPRIAQRPLPGFAPRPILQPVGEDDPDFPIPIYDAMALAHGNQQAGDLIWTSMQDALALNGLDGLAPYPVRDNLRSAAGGAYTGVVAQYEGDGILDPHHIAFQLDSVKYHFGCFFAAVDATGSGVVPPPGPLGTPCP
jgi:hypothetical protein